jgi:FMN-dependent NADH-azoreductase
MNVLQINSSSRAASLSSVLAGEIVQRLQAANAGAQVTVRDLTRTPLPELDEAALQALFTPAEQRSPAQAARVAQDDALIAEIQAADVLVLGVPMYNFGAPAQLKNWIDAIARARVTFSYTEKGPVGLLKGKKVYVAMTRGGIHRDQPSDTLVPYLRAVLGFLGMTDVAFIYAEGQGLGPEAEAKGQAEAREQIAALLADEAVAA